MRKLVLICLLLAQALFAQSLFAQKLKVTNDDGVTFNFRITSNQAKEIAITSINNQQNSNKIDIAPVIFFEGNEYTVTKIANRALAHIVGVDSLFIRQGSVSMAGDACNGSSFKYADLSGVHDVAEDCFNNCSTLRTIIFSNKLELIKDDAFNGCEGVSIIIPKKFDLSNAIHKEYYFEQNGDCVTIDSLRFNEHFTKQNGNMVYTRIETIPNASAEQLYNETLSLLSQGFTVSSSNKDSKSIVGQREIKGVYQEVENSDTFTYDASYSIRIDCKDGRIKATTILQNYSIESKIRFARDKTTRKDQKIEQGSDEMADKAYDPTCEKAITEVNRIIQGLRNMSTLTNTEEDW